ncbi:MAG: hypothetical protein C0P72_007535 [Clostridia bacterium]
MATKKSFGFLNPIVVQFDDGILTIKQAGKKVSLTTDEIKSVRAERRTFRGHVLAIDTNSDTLYFKARTEKNALEAVKYIKGLISQTG